MRRTSWSTSIDLADIATLQGKICERKVEFETRPELCGKPPDEPPWKVSTQYQQTSECAPQKKIESALAAKRIDVLPALLSVGGQRLT